MSDVDDSVVDDQDVDDSSTDDKGGTDDQSTDDQSGADGKPPIVGDGGDDDTKNRPAEFGDDWREKLGGEDAEKLARYATPQAAIAGGISAQKKLSERGPAPMPGEGATEEELAEWRKEAGLPAKAEDYSIDIGRDIDEIAQPAVDGVVAKAFELGMTEANINSIVATYFDEQDKAIEVRQTQDVETKEATEDTLREEWGGDFRRNLNLISALLGDASDKVLTGRTADGTPVGSDPEILRAFLSIALKDNPRGVTVPSTGGTMATSVDDEIGEIEKLMTEDRKKYDKDEKLQERYRDLLQWRIDHKEKEKA